MAIESERIRETGENFGTIAEIGGYYVCPEFDGLHLIYTVDGKLWLSSLEGPRASFLEDIGIVAVPQPDGDFEAWSEEILRRYSRGFELQTS